MGKKVLPYIQQIDLDLIELLDTISVHTEKWSKEGFRVAIWSVDDLDFMENLIQESKLI